MGLESASRISQLNALWPLGTDPRSQGDDHLRLIKSVLKGDAISHAETGLQSVGGVFSATLRHKDAGGYMLIGAYDATYGSGFARLWWSQTDKRLTLQDDAGAGATMQAGAFVGNGEGLSGVAKVNTAANQLGSYGFMKNVSATGYTAGAIAPASALRYSNIGGTEGSTTVSGSWLALGIAIAGQVTLFQKVA